MSDFEFISGDPDNLTGGSAANMVDIQGPFVDLREWLNTDLQPRVAKAVPAFATSLPVGAVDGQEIYYLADDANGVVWHLRYRATSASAYKWEFVGGAELMAVTSGVVSFATTAGAPTTGGPTVTAPLAGDYRILFGADLYNNTANTTAVCGLYIAGANSGVIVINTMDISGGGSGNFTSAEKWWTATLTAGQVLDLRYWVSAGSAQAQQRNLSIRPLRVG